MIIIISLICTAICNVAGHETIVWPKAYQDPPYHMPSVGLSELTHSSIPQ